MKKLVILIGIFSSYSLSAQNPPVVEKAAPKSNNLLPSGGTLGSNSGVNPNGNPGTIASYSGNSNSINSKTAPNPNIEPGVYLSSSPEGTVITTTINNPQQSTTVTAATVTATGGTVTASVDKPIKTSPAVAPVITKTIIPNEAVVGKVSTPVTTMKVAPVSKPAVTGYSPVLGNYVPEQVINRIKNKYGPSVYDIRTVRVLPGNKIAYIVRLTDKGKLHDELYYDEP